MGHPVDSADNPPSRRLSRPRSLVSSSHFLKRLEQHHKTLLSLTPSTSYEAGDYPTFARSKSRERSIPQDARSKLRTYLQASRNVKADSSDDDDDDGQRGLPGIAKGVKHRLSRVGTASSTTQLSSAGASTSQLSSYSNPQMDLADSARMVEEIKEKAYMDSIAARNHVSSPVDEDMHVDSIPSPIRRKSLYTPGIATRTPDDILRKPPPPQILQSQADRDYYFNPGLSTSSPLARLAALETTKSGRSTPTLDYSHLGGLGLGTLRVTNGPASPQPQEVVSHPSDTPAPYVVDENQASETVAKRKSHEKAAASSDGSCESNEERNNRDTESRIRGRRSRSPLKHEHVIDDKVFEETPSRSAHTKWLTRKQSFPSGLFLTSSDPASAMALDYRKALPDTPFQRAQTATGNISRSRSDSNTDEIDDTSIVDKGHVMCKSYRSASEMWGSFSHDGEQMKPNSEAREDAYRKLNANSACQQSSVSRPTSSSASAKTVDLRSICTDPSTIQSSKKADSGYSSSESLAVSDKTPIDDFAMANSVPENSESDSRTSSRLTGPRKSSRSVSRKVKTSDVAPSVDKQHLSFPSAVAVAQLAPLTAHSTGIVSKEKTASQTLIIPSPRSVSKTRKPGKAKRLSQQLPVNSIIVQGTRQLSQSQIPEVPKAVALKHAERLHKFPSLGHTYPSLQHISSYESLLREEYKSMPIRFPSPAQSLERADSTCRTDLEWPSSRSIKSKKLKSASKSGPLNSSKAGRRSSQSEGLVAITDFGTVMECLGGNPYDVATSATSRAQKRASISHPHQISMARPRAKSMIGMTNESALQLAKLQSRFSTQSFSGPSISSSRSFDSIDQIAGNLLRQHRTIIDAPPVPALPAGYSARGIKRDVSQSFDSFCQESPNHEKLPNRAARPRSLVIDPQAIPTIPAKDTTKSERPDAPQTVKPRRKSFNDRSGMPGILARPRSMSEKAPPVPVLPSKSQLEHIEAQVSKSSPSKPKIVATPVKMQNSTEKTMDAVGKSTGEPFDSPDSWKSHREAWSQRRKSAGDALLLRSQVGRPPMVSTALNGPADSLGLWKPTSIAQNLSNSPIQSAMPTVKQRRPPLRHISQSQNPPPVANDVRASFQVSRGADKPSTPKPSKLKILAGRFAGGFHYGYEPGFGLGGSAGTRTSNSTASRKSVNVSRGYGLDLSDVPVFVVPR